MNESFLILCLCHASSATTCDRIQTAPSGGHSDQTTRSQLLWWWSSTYLVQPPVRVHRLRVGLVLDAVQVFVEAVQQEGHELLGVVLRVARELAGFAGHDCLKRNQGSGSESRVGTAIQQRRVLSRFTYLEFGRLEGVMGSFPKGPEQHGKADGQPSSRSQRVIAVDFRLKRPI